MKSTHLTPSAQTRWLSSLPDSEQHDFTDHSMMMSELEAPGTPSPLPSSSFASKLAHTQLNPSSLGITDSITLKRFKSLVGTSRSTPSEQRVPSPFHLSHSSPFGRHTENEDLDKVASEENMAIEDAEPNGFHEKLDHRLASQFGKSLTTFESKLEKGTIFEEYSNFCLERALNLSEECTGDFRLMLKKEAQTWDLLARFTSLRSLQIYSSSSTLDSSAFSFKSNELLLAECKTVKSWLEHWFEIDYQEGKTDYDLGFVPSPVSSLCSTQPLPYSGKQLKYGVFDDDLASPVPLSPTQMASETFYKRLFAVLKTGKIELAHHVCPPAHLPFLSRFLSGFQFQNTLFQDDLVSPHLLSELAQYHIWKKSCRFHASQLTHALYERACYSYVCGYLPGLLPVCLDFQSALLAQIQCLYVKRLETYFKEQLLEEDESTNVSASMVSSSVAASATTRTALEEDNEDRFPAYQTNFQDLLEKLEKHILPGIRHASAQFFETVQGWILTEQYARLVPWALDPARRIAPEQLRFAVHMALALAPPETEDLSLLIGMYIDQLPSLGCHALVPAYILTLPAHERAQVYTSFILRLDVAVSSSYLDAAHEVGLDVPEIGTLLTDDLLASYEAETSMFTHPKLLLIVDILERIHLAYPHQCKTNELIQKTNRVCRLLLETGDLESVYDLVCRFSPPPDLLFKDRNGEAYFWWEYVDYRSYCEAIRQKPDSKASKIAISKFLEAGLSLLERGDWLLFHASEEVYISPLTIERTGRLRRTLLRKLVLSMVNRLSVHTGLESYGVRLLKVIVRYPQHLLHEGMSKHEIANLADVFSHLPYSSLFEARGV